MPSIINLPGSLTPEALPSSLFELPYFMLLETSLFGNGEKGRYSIAVADPRHVITSDTDNIFDLLQKDLKRPGPQPISELPFAGGWVGYLGYEVYSFLEEKVPDREPDLMPRAVFGYYDSFYLYDHLRRKAFLVDTGKKKKTGLDTLLNPQPIECHDREEIPQCLKQEIQSNFSKEDYLAAIQKIKYYIEAGDCYQVNLSQRFKTPVSTSPFELYRRLRKASPSPYAAFLNLPFGAVLSSSPESFLELNQGKVITHPIKGTRRRGYSPEEDLRLKNDLLSHPKDRAELLMITDLERNDLGRVCAPGTIAVSSLQEIETFPQVHHLVSTIEGRLSPDQDIVDVLRATFPGGSITGAPKIRAMQIIHELENVPRNVYCGSIGYISRNGRAQFNIAIRTMILKEDRATFWAGGGIVADSDPESEYEETLAKAQGMMMALDPDGGNNSNRLTPEKLRK